MQLIGSIRIPRKEKEVELQVLLGSLSAIPPEHKVDILVVSAFPNNYLALPGSLMLALKEEGLSVEDLAQDKAIDLRSSIGCWFSKPLSPALQQHLNFRQILCFEPELGMPADNPGSVVGNIFRCLNTFAFDENNRSIALPVIASGYQRVGFEKMLPALIEAGLFWLKNGLPIDVIKIVIHDAANVEVARRIIAGFSDPFYPATPAAVQADSRTPAAAANTGSMIGPPPPVRFDYFISYAHTQSAPVDHFVQKLKAANPGLKIFYDRSSIPKGSRWLKEISDAIAKTSKVIIFMSPDYSASMVCWDEFQCAKLQEYKTKSDVILAIYLANDPDLPPIMGIHNYIDCRETDLDKLVAACDELLQ